MLIKHHQYAIIDLIRALMMALCLFSLCILSWWQSRSWLGKCTQHG